VGTNGSGLCRNLTFASFFLSRVQSHLYCWSTVKSTIHSFIIQNTWKRDMLYWQLPRWQIYCFVPIVGDNHTVLVSLP